MGITPMRYGGRSWVISAGKRQKSDMEGDQGRRRILRRLMKIEERLNVWARLRAQLSGHHPFYAAAAAEGVVTFAVQVCGEVGPIERENCPWDNGPFFGVRSCRIRGRVLLRGVCTNCH